MKKIISILLSSIIFVLTLVMPVSANLSESDEYIRFETSNSRIESDGSFHFYFRTKVTSDYFTADTSQITLMTQAHLYAQDGTGNTYTTKDVSFIVTLHQKVWYGSKAIMSYIAYPDDIYGGLTINVTQGKKYYFELVCQTNLDSTRYYIEGTGMVTPVTLVD